MTPKGRTHGHDVVPLREHYYREVDEVHAVLRTWGLPAERVTLDYVDAHIHVHVLDMPCVAAWAHHLGVSPTLRTGWVYHDLHGVRVIVRASGE